MDEVEIKFYHQAESNHWGLNWRQHFLYWKLDLSLAFIVLIRSRRQLDKLIKKISLGLAISGWLALLIWLFLQTQSIQLDPRELLMFWRQPHPLVLWFLLSWSFALFFIYRQSEEQAAINKIHHKPFNQDDVPLNSKLIDYNVSQAYSQAADIVLEDAWLLTNRLKQNEVGVLHLFRALLKNKEVQALFVRLGISAPDLVTKLDKHLNINDPQEFTGKLKWSDKLQELLIFAFQETVRRRQPAVNPVNLLAFCWSQDKLLADILYDLELDEDKLKNVVAWAFTNEKMLDRLRSWRKLAAFKPSSGMNRAYTAIATPTLDHFSHDLTLAAKNGRLEFCVGRQQEIDSVFESLASGQTGILLVGHTGVGKRTIVEGIAQLMVSEEVPKFLKDRRLVELDISRLVSGANPNVSQERMLSSISEASRAGNIVLYINNIENIIGITAGQEQSLDLSEVLAEALTRRHVYCLATVNSENYSRYVEGQALGEAMTTVGVAEPSHNQAIQILESKVASIEANHGIFFSYSALDQAVKLSVKYLHDKFLPAKAIDLLRSAAIISAKAARHDPQRALCQGEEVSAAISDLIGVPIQKITEDESVKLLNLEKEIHRRMIGQEEAVKAVAASLRRSRAAIKDNKRPIASFLFLGPTGVGKTELAKTVSEVYFGGEQYMVRIDMSEYQRPESVRKMIGDVDGTLGHLTEAVRKKPFALILFDEIEKAHPDILNLFLQMLDDGRLTDGQGRTISFTESIIIATSNIGANYIQEEIKKNTKVEEIRQELVDNRLNQHMRPELINRFDGIIVFTPLSEDHIFRIATLMLKNIKQNITSKGLFMRADRDGVLELARQGYDPKFGARPLRRLLQDKVENIIANKLLAGELKRRDTVIVNYRGEIEVEKGRDL